MLARWSGRERPVSHVPSRVRTVLVVALIAQCAWHWARPGPSALVSEMPPAPPSTLARAAALGDELALARGLGLWLLAFDNPPGVNVPFQTLDYARLEGWLDLTLDLDGRATFPLLAAARLYTSVQDEAKTRRMLALVNRRFLEAPNERWRWMADAALIARHRLKDLDLAKSLARDIRTHATAAEVPFWAKDLYLLVLQDRCELEAAKILIGGLLAEGQIRDPHELTFLEGKLAELEAAQGCPERVEEAFPGGVRARSP